MNRREALRLLVALPIAAPAVVKAAAEPLLTSPDWRWLAGTARIDVGILAMNQYLEEMVNEMNKRLFVVVRVPTVEINHELASRIREAYLTDPFRKLEDDREA